MYATELSHQREALMQRLAEFDSTNRTLRTLLRSQQSKEVVYCVYETWSLYKSQL